LKQEKFIITKHNVIAADIHEMILSGGETEHIRPGQFVNLSLPEKFLRRPISVCDCDSNTLTLVFKVVGSGTEQMANMWQGQSFDMLTGLGNGFDLSKAGDAPLLVGGGVGVPPMYMLAKELIKQGKKVSVVLGFNTKDDVFYEDKFKELGAEVRVTTMDGSYGTKGVVTDVLPECSFFYACGPRPMLKALAEKCPADGEVSMEERMGCGFGACMGCTIETKSGPRRVCKEGPVFPKDEIIW